MQYGLRHDGPGSDAFASEPRPWLGFGLGLRTEYFEEIIENPPVLDWFEITSENFMVAGGKPRHYLERIRERYPLVMHGVSLSIGSTDPLDFEYLSALRQLARDVEPAWVSDHLCWTGVGGVNSHDLLPLPYSEEAIAHVVRRVEQVQDFLGREILLENLSSYVEFNDSQMPEWEFVAQVARRSGSRILLDINNIQVSARNHGFDPLDYMAGLPADRIWQIHLAGHSDYGDYCIDTHDHEVPAQVWSLYESAIRRFGPISTMIERDDHYPSLTELLAELDLAREAYGRAERRERAA
ncbi:MNIO family bufferin maturase [Lysobacter sp. CA196]|uniref:MNIO family bufferin maturase n=1 Tax=Lysobacter sp. CA196 TaxID=3455606 RepID=UPI003F8D89DE